MAGDQEGGGGGAARLPHPGRHPPLQEQRGGFQGLKGQSRKMEIFQIFAKLMQIRFVFALMA